MNDDTARALYQALRQRAAAHGIRVCQQRLDPETPGRFDGPSVTMNTGYAPREAAFYLAHAIGSIVYWATDPGRWAAAFEELDAAKEHRRDDPVRLERALERYRAFEDGASAHAVWLLADLGFAAAVGDYTNFWRADLEAMVQRHRGRPPIWREFFAQWNREVAAGTRRVEPYAPRPIPPFRPVKMRPMDVVQEKDGQA